jgi:hypothetical protein
MAQKQQPIDRALSERVAVLLGDRAKAAGKRAVRIEDLEREVLSIVNKWAKDKGLIP